MRDDLGLGEGSFSFEFGVPGMDEQPPDAFVVIDTSIAKQFGLDFRQSDLREEHVLVMSAVPPQAIKEIVAPKSFMTVPIIDISGPTKRVVQQLHYACTV